MRPRSPTRILRRQHLLVNLESGLDGCHVVNLSQIAHSCAVRIKLFLVTKDRPHLRWRVEPYQLVPAYVMRIFMSAQESESRGSNAAHPLNPYVVVENDRLSHIKRGEPRKTLAIARHKVFGYLPHPGQRSKVQRLCS